MHHHHQHNKNEKRVLWALLLTGIFMVVEFAGGVISSSLALIADAGHMLTDTAALALAWGAFRISRRPPDRLRSYGYDRFQVLAAFINGLVLLALVAWIMWEAAGRIMTPEKVLGVPMIIVATLGLIANLVAFKILHRKDEQNLNMKGAILHVISDILGSAAAIIAAGVILLTDWYLIDPILSILISLLILRAAWMLVRKATHILMEGTPDTFDVEALKADLVKTIPGLVDVHHVHVWLLTAERPLLTMHASVKDIKKSEKIMQAVKKHLGEKYEIAHSTVQIETTACCADNP